MKTFSACAFVLSSLAIAIVGCDTGQSICQKEFDCKTELKLNLEDDYVDVCAAERDGQNNALTKNAEKECKDLATAEVVLATCESTLSCADLVKSRSVPRGDTVCKSPGTDFDTKLKAADFGAKCTGITEGGLTGEGEGEGGQ